MRVLCVSHFSKIIHLFCREHYHPQPKIFVFSVQSLDVFEGESCDIQFPYITDRWLIAGNIILRDP